MKKSAYFGTYWDEGWPSLTELETYFLGPSGKEWFSIGGNDSASLSITEAIGAAGPRDITLYLVGIPGTGVHLSYQVWTPNLGLKETFESKGDLRRVSDSARSLDGSLVPVALMVPFTAAWEAVREFMATDGQLPASIQWIAGKDLPADFFPDQ